MDESSLLIELLNNNFSTSATTLQTAGTISATHAVVPTIIDIRNLNKNTAVRYDMSNKTIANRTSDLIIIYEDGQTLNYPTIHYDIADETYNMTMHIRCIHDERASGDANFGRDRLRALYLIARHTLESKRRGFTASDGTRINQLFVGARSESNDRNKRLFGYKVNVELKRFAVTVP